MNQELPKGIAGGGLGAAPGLDAGMRNVANDEAYRIMQAERCRAVPQEELERRMREQVPMMLNAYRPVLPEEPPKAPPSLRARICRWLGI